MPITTLELNKKINATQNDWVSVSGNVTESPLDSGIEPFWQFRVAIKPTRANAIKAVNALALLPQFTETLHPEFKVFMPAENGDFVTQQVTHNVQKTCHYVKRSEPRPLKLGLVTRLQTRFRWF